MSRSGTLALDTLLHTPYFKGKGIIALSILQLCKAHLPIPGRTPNGARLLLHLDNGHNAMLPYLIGQYEHEFIEVFIRCVKALAPSMAFVDVGANIGLYTCMAAKEFGTIHAGNTVYSFEPNPEAFQRLQANITLNQYSHTHCLPIGVSDVTGTFTLFVTPKSNTVGSLRHVDDYLTEQIAIPVTTLDHYLQDGSTHIGLIKADIEGGELYVLRGACTIIGRDRPIILFEENAGFCKAWGHQPADIHDYLQSLQYDLRWITKDARGNTQLIGLPENKNEDGQTRNILAWPKGTPCPF